MESIRKPNSVKVSLDHEAKKPERQNSEDAGFDLYATYVEYQEQRNVVAYGTGVRVALPPNFAGVIHPRSSIYKRNLMLANNTGIIDPGYRGEIKVMIKPLPGAQDHYEVGERIAQLVFMPAITPRLNVVDELPDSERGEGGFGSTGQE